jgi:GWxTD domain-containing protein
MKMDLETIGWRDGNKGTTLGRVFFVLAITPMVLLLWMGSSQAAAGGSLPFFVDTAAFQALGDSGKSYVELYILLSSKSLEFREEEGEYWAHLGLKAAIRNGQGQETWSRQWRKRILVSSQESLERGSSILDIAGLIAESDFYDLRVDLRDEFSGDSGFVAGELYVPGFLPDTLSISQVELALEITPSQEEGDFVKNGLRVLPNPSRVYGPKAPILYYYLEIYDLVFGPGFDSTYTIQQEVLSLSGELVKRYDPKIERKPGRTSVEVGGVNVVGLEPETYIFRIRVRDNASGAEVYSQRWFLVTDPQRDAKLPSLEIAALTPEEAEFHENVIRYIASKRELDTYKDLTLEGKARFLDDFWRWRDPDPSTTENEFKEEHVRRWHWAARQYSKFQLNDGWKSDRGRVYIVYGPPDDIERHPSDLSTAAWERWNYYSLEGGIYFIFADLSGFDHFVLLHSTARNELRDRDWQEKLFHTPQ